CRRHSVPYRLVGSVRFYDRKEIRDVLSYLRLIANPSDDEAFRRAITVPRRGIGETTVDAIAERARTHGMSLFAGVSRPDLTAELRGQARTGLATFVELIEKYRALAADMAVDEMIRDLVIDINYADHVRAEGEEVARERLDNIRELINGAAETVEDEGGEVS